MQDGDGRERQQQSEADPAANAIMQDVGGGHDDVEDPLVRERPRVLLRERQAQQRRDERRIGQQHAGKADRAQIGHPFVADRRSDREHDGSQHEVDRQDSQRAVDHEAADVAMPQQACRDQKAADDEKQRDAVAEDRPDGRNSVRESIPPAHAWQERSVFGHQIDVGQHDARRGKAPKPLNRRQKEFYALAVARKVFRGKHLQFVVLERLTQRLGQRPGRRFIHVSS